MRRRRRSISDRAVSRRATGADCDLPCSAATCFGASREERAEKSLCDRGRSSAMSYRIAFFTDTLHEVNGVALTSREFLNFARRRSIPMFSVHAGPANRVLQDGSIVTWEFRRSSVRLGLEHDLGIDLLFFRFYNRLLPRLREFCPDLVHITGPGDAGILGAMAAWELKVPLAASWHTNLHEFAARRLSQFLSVAPSGIRRRLANWVERQCLDRCLWFYGLARVVFAPNPELADAL